MPILTGTYQDPQLHNDWTAIYRDNALQQRFNSEMLDRFLSFLQLRPGSVFLDAGCGRGDHAIRLLQRGYRGVGIDISGTVLRRAQEHVAVHCDERSKFQLVRGCLEMLPFADCTFDFVHCRGVLMHVPDWKAALTNLCRVLKPNGCVLVMENNERSFQTKVLLAARALIKTSSRMTRTKEGLEFWSVINGQPFLVRVANTEHIKALIQDCGVKPLCMLSAGFFDIGRIPFSWARNLAIEFNRAYAAAHLPARLSSGVALLGRKVAA